MSNFEEMNYRDLQAAAKDLGVKANGTKADLIARLLEATAAAKNEMTVEVVAAEPAIEAGKAQSENMPTSEEVSTSVAQVVDIAVESAAEVVSTEGPAPIAELNSETVKTAAVMEEVSAPASPISGPVASNISTPSRFVHSHPKSTVKKSSKKTPLQPLSQDYGNAKSLQNIIINTTDTSIKQPKLKARADADAEIEDIFAQMNIDVEKHISDSDSLGAMAAGKKTYFASPIGSPKPVTKWTYAEYEN